tara:strand:+ start:2232 stop:2714 length:483 start_codon:yes stop_codon:yes gene_type:complete
MTNLNINFNNILPQNVYRLTEYGVAVLAQELAHYQDDKVRVGALSAICDEWCIQVLKLEQDGTVIVLDVHNFLNENFICEHYSAMVKHEEHAVDMLQDFDASTKDHYHVEREFKRIEEELKELREYIKSGDLADWEYDELHVQVISLENEWFKLAKTAPF